MAEQQDRAAIEQAEAILYEEGTKLRQEIFGKRHIDQSKLLSAFQQPLQTMAVTAGWSLCWSRPGLERKTRSLLCLVMLAVLGRDHELGVHVRGAIANGCTEEEIREALFQVWGHIPLKMKINHELTVILKVSVYAGLPCALNATKVAWRELEDMKSRSGGNETDSTQGRV